VFLNIAICIIGDLFSKLRHLFDFVNLGFVEKLNILQKQELYSALDHLLHIDGLIFILFKESWSRGGHLSLNFGLLSNFLFDNLILFLD
jgi:hypothetical protein